MGVLTSLVILFVLVSLSISMGSTIVAILQYEKKQKQIEEEHIHFELYLSPDALAALERLQQLTGKPSLAATLKSALKLYGVVEKDDNGKKIMVVNCTHNKEH